MINKPIFHLPLQAQFQQNRHPQDKHLLKYIFNLLG